MDSEAVTYISLLMTALSLLLTYLNSENRTKQIIFRLWIVFSAMVLIQGYARDLYAMLQPGQPATWKTILLANGLMLGLLTYAAAIPLLWWNWRKVDKQNNLDGGLERKNPAG